jgi:methylthioribose-1-phosphate isomerase
MNVSGKHYRTIWTDPSDPKCFHIIDQRFLPHRFVTQKLCSVSEVATAISDMHVRGAGLIGATAGFGMYLAALEASSSSFLSDLEKAGKILTATRPTAVNLEWAVRRQIQAISRQSSTEERINTALQTAIQIADEDASFCRSIGEHGSSIIEKIAQKKQGGTVNILTHCNAGWLAFVDYGSATAPIYAAFEKGIDIHVWVDETRPRNQGASLTAWELLNHGVPHTVITDNAGGHLMQHGLVDMVITGADRVTRSGDAANKIGTYLKALAARDNHLPFYVALPSSTFDWSITDGLTGIPIEERDPDEVRFMQGLCDNEIRKVLITPEGSTAKNYGFDVTPSRLITGLITERGICKADQASISELFSEHTVTA